MVEEIDGKKIRQYLLGEMAEAEMPSFEERLMTEDLLFEMLLVGEDELIDERAANELLAEEQARFDAYFLATPQRRERLELARALHEYAAEHAAPKPVVNPNSGATNNPMNAAPSENLSEPEGEDIPAPATVIRPSRWSSPVPYLGLAAAAAVLIAVGIVAWRIFIPPADMNQGLAALNQAYREQRPTEARITGFNYAPLLVMRGADSNKVDTLERNRAELILSDEVKDHPNARSYHDIGRFYLAERQFDRAIEYFEKALRLDENNAQIHSDLGAAYLEKGKAVEHSEVDGGSRDFARSLEQLTRALELNDAMLEARFNRALVYESLRRTQEARQEWRKYLDRDPSSRWGAEAKQKLDSIKE